ATIESFWRPYTDEERTLLLGKLRYFYDRFVDTVARGRQLTAAQVDAIGRGHVWSGDAAQTRKLVDQMGGLMEAVAEAKRLAGLRDHEDIELVPLPEEPSLLKQVAGLFGIGGGGGSSQNGLPPLPGLTDLARALP